MNTRTSEGSSLATNASPPPPPYVACAGRTVGYVVENVVPVTYAMPVALAATSPMKVCASAKYVEYTRDRPSDGSCATKFEPRAPCAAGSGLTCGKLLECAMPAT